MARETKMEFRFKKGLGWPVEAKREIRFKEWWCGQEEPNKKCNFMSGLRPRVNQTRT